MCGIAGLIMKNGEPPAPPMLQAMTRALAHRGPDGSGEYIYGATALLHLRLAIIDLNGGQQPMQGGTDNTLVGNGEIYNYLELKAGPLRDQLFTTESDFEPIIHLVARDGVDAIQTLRGMYAFALHNQSQDVVILARDAFGIKPLYYADTADYFAFASEPAALFPVTGKPGLLPDKQRELLEIGYIAGAQTIFAGINRLMPGDVFTLKRGAITARQQIAALPAPSAFTLKNFDDAVTQFDRIFENSVLVHQRSDVPYGMFLSGGLDSTAILTMMARLNSQPVLAFTCGFDSASVADERPQARATAQALGATHIEIEFTESDFWNLLPRVAAALDDPVIDYATLPTFKLAAAAQPHVKVILSGEGGDEILAGYGRYRKARRPWWLGGDMRPLRPRFDGLGILRDGDNRWQKNLRAYRTAAHDHRRSNLQNAQAVDFAGWLPDDLLIKLDRCLMRHGIEGRTPFLDHAMMDFCFNLPDDFKIRDKQGKYLLRAWLATYGPKVHDYNARKRGFTVPVGDWISRAGGRLGPLVAHNAGIMEIADPAAVKALFATTGKQCATAQWSLLFYAVWHKIHCEEFAADGTVFDLLTA